MNSDSNIAPAPQNSQDSSGDQASRYDAIPQSLRDLRQWLLFRLRPRQSNPAKSDKFPYYTDNTLRRGTQGSEEDRARLASFDEALAALEPGGYDGLGLAMLPDAQMVALDFDDCVDEQGNVEQWVLDLVVGTYAEFSPSGRGIRAFFSGVLRDFKNNPEGVEVFHAKGFVTVTGRVLKL